MQDTGAAGAVKGTGAALTPVTALTFGTFRLDAANALLTEGTRALGLTPKAFAVLCHLAGRPGLLVTKDQLLDAVWGRRFVSESVLKTAINAIRTALGDDSRQPRYVETVPRRGYRFIGTAAAGVGPVATTVPPASQPPEPPVGRAFDAAQLTGWLALARSGQRQMVFVGGDAGIGKSTLIRHLAEVARACGDAVAFGQCVDQAGGGEPYLPILDALSALARGPTGTLWLAALRQAAPTWLAQLPWLVPPGDQASLREALAGAAQDRMLREFDALLDAVAPSHPLLLVIEDLHWSDHATVSLLDFLARRRGPARCMVVASYRPTDVALSEHPMQALRQELRLHRLCREIVLEPFSERDVDAYLHERLRGHPVAQHESLARALHAHTEGLPLFLSNVLDDLEGGGPQLHDAAAWDDPVAALARLHLPDTVVGIVERQISRLPGDLRDLLEAASVVGLEFSEPMLAAVLAQPADALRTRCDGLARRGEWLRGAGMTALPDGSTAGRYAFRHAVYRRVFYERCAPASRLQWHLRAAAALAAHADAQGDRVAAEMALHFEGARDTAAASGMRHEGAARDAMHWRLRAARAAVAVHAPADALAHFARVARAELPAAQRVLVPRECADLHQQLGHGDAALAQADLALAAARENGDADVLQDVMLQRATIAQQSDHPREAIELVDELLAAEAPISAPRRSRALLVKADSLGSMGQLDDADAAAREALACLPADAHAERARHLAGRVAVRFQRGQFEEGLLEIAQALELFERIGDAVGAATMVSRRGVFSLLLGRTAQAEVALLEARARARALNDVQGQRSALLNLVKLRTDRGDAESSLALLDEGLHLAAAFESPVTECAFLSGFYYCHYLRGDLGAALDDAARVLDSARGLNSVYWRLSSLVLVCDLHIHLGQLDRADALVAQAMAEANAREVHQLWPKVGTHRAWLDVLAGDAPKALASLDAMRDSGAEHMLEDLAVMARVRAQAHLSLGEPQVALAALEGFDGAPTHEAWALLLATRLRARLTLGSACAADFERAMVDLSDSRLPALESVVLRQTLVDALVGVGRPEAAAAQAALLEAHRVRLIASLAGAPPAMAAAVRALGKLAC